jgi:hypothetical protein
MNKQDIIKRLTNIQLDSHERESLLQLLHYLQAEGLNNTSSINNNSHTSSSSKTKNTSSKKHTSSKKNTR